MPRALARRRSRVASLVLAGLIAGCGTGGPPASGASLPPAIASQTPATPVAVAPDATPSTDPTPVPTVALSEPPVALLVVPNMPGEPAVGPLGSFTWGDHGSDAPWIVPRHGALAVQGATVNVTFDPAVTPAAWTVRWAPIAAGGAGDVASASQGGDAVAFDVPGQAGAWSLQLEARFGTGRSASWYWRVDVR